MNYDLSEDGTECIPQSMILEKLKMFKTKHFEEIWAHGKGPAKIRIIRGTTLAKLCKYAAEGEDKCVGAGDKTCAYDPTFV